jgi:hypothetical protein
MIAWDAASEIASWADSLLLLVWGAIDLSRGHRRDGSFLLALGLLAAAVSGASHYKEKILTLEMEQTRTAGASAIVQIEQLRRQNLELQKELEVEHSRRALIEDQLAPRVLTSAQGRAIESALRAFSGHMLKVDIQPDPEAKTYAASILRTLEKIGWHVDVRTNGTGSITSLYGIYVGGPNLAAPSLQALVTQLVKVGNPVYVEQTNDAYDYMAINLRPSQGMSPRLMLADRDSKGWRLPAHWKLSIP